MTEHETQGQDRAAGSTIRFGPFELDVERRLLRRDSQPVPIGTRALDILMALLARAGQVIATQELIAHAWPRSIAVEANLRAQILALRRALRDGEDGLRLIQNVPGRGYRFVGPLENQPQSAATERPVPPDHSRALAAINILGRDEIVDGILARLPHRRLLTIIGPGGIGKTTVALAVAGAFGPTCADGVRWIDLSTSASEESAAEAVALAIGLMNFTSDHSPAVISWLKDKHLLLVLDCTDRMVGSVAALAEMILSETAAIYILVTSREALRASGEHVVRLPPLSVPPSTPTLSADQALTYPAVQLFAERAAAVRGGFTLRDEDVPHVVRICTSLDGIALAIELAAGHLVALELANLAALLEDKFRLLPVGRRTALARHRTMHAALEWSYDTLSPRERELLIRLAIFEGESSMAGIRAVTTDSGRSTEELVQTLARLVDKSLVATRITPAGLTYNLLDTTRGFALERLKEAGKFEEISRRHAQFVLDTLHQIEANNQGLRAADWIDARRRELANMRAALNWAYESDAGEVLRLALSAVAARILLDLSLVEQCRRRIAQALSAMAQNPTSDLALEMRLKVILALASFYTPGPIQETVATLERVLAISEVLHDAEFRAIALWGLWSVSIFRSEPERALSFAQQFRSTPTDLTVAARGLLVDRMTGIALHLLGDQPGARECLERVSTRFDPAVHAWSRLGLHVDHGLMARIYLARVLWLQGELDGAARTCHDSVEALRSQGHAIAQCHALFEVAIPLSYMSGDLAAANANVALLQDLADQHGLAIFQAGAALAMRVFSAIQHKTNLSACRAAAQALRACRYEAQYPWLSAIVAEEALRRGDTAAGLEWISPCLANDNGAISGWWLAELLRLRGELAAAGPTPEVRDRARAHLQEAVDTARRQGALMLELRATVSRIGIDRAHRAPAELKSELDNILGRFSRGSGAAELVAARRLSADLAG